MPSVEPRIAFEKVKCPSCGRMHKIAAAEAEAFRRSLPGACECMAPKPPMANDPTLATEDRKLLAQHEARIGALEGELARLRGDLATIMSALEAAVNDKPKPTPRPVPTPAPDASAGSAAPSSVS